jgi:diadenosine tetraphosphate (Ap4A) HIT family hydrolase
MGFQLHPELAKDTYNLGSFPLSILLLSKDANYPWFILVPQRADISESFELTLQEQNQLQQESLALSRAVYSAFTADKLNIAALGNVVPQLHVHHIVRYTSDIAWPNPVWGFADAQPYSQELLKTRFNAITSALSDTQFVPASHSLKPS